MNTIPPEGGLPHATAVPAGARGERALVLGGGGSAGNAWAIGVIAGLLDEGVDVTEADLIVGTSAGSTVAAQITGEVRADELLAAIVATPVPTSSRAASAGAAVGGASIRPAVNHFERSSAAIAAAEDAADMRRRMGASALESAAGSEDSVRDRWRTTVASRLPGAHWPDRRILIPAVDAHTGEPVVFDRDSGIELVDAVAASCSSGEPYRIGERHYIDGGYRRNENADLAAGYARVLVLSPLGGRTRHPLEWGMQLAAQVDELRQGGSLVATILPDAASLAAFGANLMDLSTRPAAARAGHEQGSAAAAGLLEFWR